MAQKIKKILTTLALALLLTLPVATSASALVADPSGSTTTKTATKTATSCNCHPEDCGGSPLTKRQLDSCENCRKTGTTNCLKGNVIVEDLNTILNALTILASIVVIAMIIVGGIQYTMAGGNAQAAVNARKRITDSLIALFSLILIYAFLQWLVPGGVF